MPAVVQSLNYRQFGIDSSRGFLPPDDPPIRFRADSGPLRELESIGEELPELLESHDMRRRLEGFPLLNPEAMEMLGASDVVVAARIYAFLASAYIHQIGEPETDQLPKTLALPLFLLSKRLGRSRPILSYDLYCLNNWRRTDAGRPIKLGNLDTIQKFVRIPDEPWFILVHTEIESEAAPAICSIGQLQQAVADDKLDKVEGALSIIGSSLVQMISTLRRMPEGNSPDVYAFAFRPYIQMFDGVYFQGVTALEGPQALRGETGAQSSIIPSLDKALGIRHQRTDLTDYVSDMRNYMPAKHRAFIEAVSAEEASKPLREYLKTRASKEAAASYNFCLDKISEFRQQHLEYAVSYIQSKVTDENGTGGTPFMKWLAQLRDETESSKVAV